MAHSATHDVAKEIERSRAVFANLVKQLPVADRERHLTRHAADLQRSIDALLYALDPTGPAPVDLPTTSKRAPRVAAHVAAPTCTHIHEAVAHADAASVPGAVRAVLAAEAAGLSTRAIVEGVNVLRPGTPEASVSNAIHQMRKRGELAREGFHKNYRYKLVAPANANGATPRGEAMRG